MNEGDDKGYKVFYYAGKSDEPILTIREQINYSNIYVVKFNGLGATGRSVKRVTAISIIMLVPLYEIPN